jgi:hypothetical protein
MGLNRHVNEYFLEGNKRSREQIGDLFEITGACVHLQNDPTSIW